jgi:spermidine synthase
MSGPSVLSPTQPWTELARARTAEGDELVLRQRGGIFEIRCNGWELMSNRAHHSEEQAAILACEGLTEHGDAPEILVGGLGMGFTLRAALDAAPPSARITVSEKLPEIIAWNRGPLSSLAGCPLDDPRVNAVDADVADLLAMPARFAAIVLDVDNGPDAVMIDANHCLYTEDGLRRTHRALTATGRLSVWSADRSTGFECALRSAGFGWRSVDIPARGRPADPMHTIYLAWPASAR